MNTEKAILAGGCFWGVEELIRALPGIRGYKGGDQYVLSIPAVTDGIPISP